MWIRLTLGIGILVLPYYIKIYGLMTGTIIILISSVVNYFTYEFIFKAASFTKSTSYTEILEVLFPPWISKIFRFTYFMDLFSTLVIYTLVSYDIFKIVLVKYGIFESYYEEWIENKDVMSFNESHPQVIMLRVIYFICLYLITFPIFLLRSLNKL